MTVVVTLNHQKDGDVLFKKKNQRRAEVLKGCCLMEGSNYLENCLM